MILPLHCGEAPPRVLLCFWGPCTGRALTCWSKFRKGHQIDQRYRDLSYEEQLERFGIVQPGKKTGFQSNLIAAFQYLEGIYGKDGANCLP